MVDLAITGAAGRMGSRLIALAQQDRELRVVAAIERADHPQMSRDAGDVAGVGAINVPIAAEVTASPKVLIDFSSPDSMRHWLKFCRDRGIAMVIGTTGLKESDHASIDEASRDIAVLQAPNMSLGVNLLFRIAGEVARRLGSDYDIEIVEAHHRFKKDAPSGTAIGLSDAISNAAGRSQVPMHSLRIGDEVGRHTAYFAALGERLELTHVATTRDTFALGALRAAKWLSRQKRGRYGMNDVLGLP